MTSLCRSRLRELHISQRYNETKSIQNILRSSQASIIASVPLTILHLGGVVLKLDVFQRLCYGLKGSLTELLISGVLCNSSQFDGYMEEIGT